MTRRQRTVRWTRHHPRTTGLGVVALVAFVVVAAVSGPSSDGDRQPAADASTSSPAVGSTTAPGPSTGAPSSRPAASVSPSRVTDVAADRAQRTSTLASAVLATLTIKGRAPRTGYDRDRFGSAWSDDNDSPLGRNGCDTRNDILRRDLSRTTLRADSNGCTVLSGVLGDPYTNDTIAFRRGPSSSGRVQIDHVVALSDAWQKGAQRYDQRTRTDLANDPLNLLAVDGPTNGAKGDGDAATWLPPNKAYRCSYVARQIAVKARYRLWMTRAEHDAAARVLTSCPTRTVPAEDGRAHLGAASEPRPVETTTAAPRPAPSPPANVHYDNCDAVRAAGAAPIHSGDPGYAAHLDRDGDGVGCEP